MIKTTQRPPRLCGLFLFLLFSLPVFANDITQALHSSWQFSEAGKNEWLPATVPGTVHTDLLANGKIPDPYAAANEAKVQWVETKSWEYKTTFDASSEVWKCKDKELVFEGLDTYAFVYLNDTLVLTAENMFRTYHVPVTKLLKKQNNILRIVFHPASELVAKNKAKSDFKNFPGGERVFIRKAQYEFGWDWGPRLVTSGIWRPVSLVGKDNFSIDNFQLVTDSIARDTAYLSASGISDFPGESIAFSVSADGKNYPAKRKETAVKNAFHFVFAVPHPKLWWCNGLGKAYLYAFSCKVEHGKQAQLREFRSGIRTIALDQTKDANGAAFTFVLNGRTVFAKGANWIPADNFLPRVNAAKYFSYLKSAQQSNMNMLRVWGGGVYEDDRFYALCDSLGIMVWQDFMFAGSTYPEGLLQESVDEVSDNIKRLQLHPCIALWCGNNEITEGWYNWDWQKDQKYSAADSAKMWTANQLFFGDVLRERVKSLGGNVPYWPSSPSTGWGHKEAFQSGDVHYWGVWWGKEAFEAYNAHVGRFVSEYGFQGMPALSSFQKLEDVTLLSLKDEVVRAHQKNEGGYETIQTYMQRDYPVPAAFADYIYVSQVMQRDGISKAVRAQRCAMPYCMGTLLWQLDDCWPVTSWSAIDYYGQPKLLQYALKELYAPIMVSVSERNDSVLLYVINDDTVRHNGILGFQWMSLADGSNARTSIARTTVYTGTSTMELGFNKKVLFDALPAEQGVLNVVFSYEGDKSVSVKYYFANDKTLQLKKDPGLVTDLSNVKNANGSYTLTLRTVNLAKNVYLTLPGDPDAVFSNNGFDLMPGETKDIEVSSTLAPEEIKKELHIQLMNAL